MADIRLVKDSDKLEIGARSGGDLNLFHNATNSFIENETGILYVTNKANTSLILGTNSTTAVTIDNSQNVTIAGGLVIDQDDNGDAIAIDIEATSAHGLTIAGDALTTGSAGVFSTSSTAFESTITGGLVEIKSTGNTGSNINNVLLVQNDDASSANTNCLTIDQDANQVSLRIDSEATTGHTVFFPAPATTTGNVLFIDDCNALTTGKIARFYSAATGTQSRNLVEIINDADASVGTTALKIQQDSTGPAIDVGGGYIANEQGRQDHVANTMSAPYYRFDGSNDYIDLGEISTHLASLQNSVSVWVRTTNTSGQCIISDETDAGYAQTVFLYLQADGTVLLRRGSSEPAEWGAISTTTVNDGKWHHIVGIDNGSALSLYIDGVAETLSSSPGTYGVVSASGENVAIGVLARDNSSGPFSGEISKVQIYNNDLSATEVKELYSGASVPFKYKGGNQTELITTPDLDGGSGTPFIPTGWSNWQAEAGDITGDTGAGTVTFSTNAGDEGLYTNTYTLVKGKAYIGNITISSYTSGTLHWVSSLANAHPPNITAAGSYSWVFIATGTSGTTRIASEGGAASMVMSRYSLRRAGAVAEYDGSGVTNDKWYDKSGNGFDGTVSGATDENTAGAPWISANHPAFLARPSDTQSDPANNETVVFDTEIFDQDGNFASNTLTAPVTGRYQLSYFIYSTAPFDTATSYQGFQLVTSNRTYESIIDPDIFDSAGVYYPWTFSVLADMDASDTAYVKFVFGAGTITMDIQAGSSFSGFLVC